MKKLFKTQQNRGMTYVELIVVLAIFGVMSSIVLFNYGEFQAKVDIKSWVNDIALKIVEAQKSAMSGKLPAGSLPGWRPAYGVYFNSSFSALDPDGIFPNKKIIYFADFSSPINGYDIGLGELLETMSITKNISVFKIERCSGDSCTLVGSLINSLSITFKRPDSSAIFNGSGVLYDPNNLATGLFDYIQITIASPRSVTAKIRIYPSGRIQVN